MGGYYIKKKQQQEQKQKKLVKQISFCTLENIRNKTTRTTKLL